jgi:hypothetical protein
VNLKSVVDAARVQEYALRSFCGVA